MSNILVYMNNSYSQPRSLFYIGQVEVTLQYFQVLEDLSQGFLQARVAWLLTRW